MSTALTNQIQQAIEEKIPGAEVQVQMASPGHFSIQVISEQFGDKNRVQQQQLVYGAIAHLMAGTDAPVHAIDRMECLVP